MALQTLHFGWSERNRFLIYDGGSFAPLAEHSRGVIAVTIAISIAVTISVAVPVIIAAAASVLSSAASYSL